MSATSTTADPRVLSEPVTADGSATALVADEAEAPAERLVEVVHAFAISTDKSQGGEYPAVVLALLPGHYMLLQSHLLYTAVSGHGSAMVL